MDVSGGATVELYTTRSGNSFEYAFPLDGFSRAMLDDIKDAKYSQRKVYVPAEPSFQHCYYTNETVHVPKVCKTRLWEISQVH